MKHTPGPWVRIGTDVGTADCAIASISVMSVVTMKRDEREANAILIAAAPELLQALKQMLDAFHHDPLGGSQDAAVEAALDAVAKAQGEK